MKLPVKPAQTQTLNSLSIQSALITVGVISGLISPWWLCLGIPLAMAAFTAESNTKR